MPAEISVIIPVYNASMSLERCVRSLLSQDFKDFDLIIVDDGSEDNSVQIIKHFAQADIRIVSICQKHSGVSAARNCALRYAKGKYICFVDADDYVEPDYLSSLYAHRECDLVMSGYNVDYMDEYGNLLREEAHPLLQTGAFDIREGCDALYALFESGSMHMNWNKMFRADIIHRHHISYKDIPINEDYAFTIDYLACAKSLFSITGTVYHWTRIKNHRTGVDSMPNNLVDIYLESCTQTKKIFNNSTLVDMFYYYTYEFLVRKYLKAIQTGQISKDQAISILRKMFQHPSVKASFKFHRPLSPSAKIAHYLLRFGFWGIYERFFL